MDQETEKYFMGKLQAMQVRRLQENIEFQQFVEEFANATGKKPSEIIDEKEITITWPAHMKPPKKNGNGNGRHHRGNKSRSAESS